MSLLTAQGSGEYNGILLLEGVGLGWLAGLMLSRAGETAIDAYVYFQQVEDMG